VGNPTLRMARALSSNSFLYTSGSPGFSSINGSAIANEIYDCSIGKADSLILLTRSDIDV
jgi:hypothetical protein